MRSIINFHIFLIVLSCGHCEVVLGTIPNFCLVYVLCLPVFIILLMISNIFLGTFLSTACHNLYHLMIYIYIYIRLKDVYACNAKINDSVKKKILQYVHSLEHRLT